MRRWTRTRGRWRGRAIVGLPLALLIWAGDTLADPPSSRPDLIVDAPRLAKWTVVLKYVPPGDCTIVEGCILAPGVRKLLVFGIQTANISQNALNLGDPTTSPFFEFSPCHGHYHLLEFSDYRLSLPGTTGTLVTARKQSWCLTDIVQYVFEPWVPTSGGHDCGTDPGLTPGWSDIYDAGLDCQWLDVTNIPPGPYDLTAEVNSGRRIPESNYGNNTSTSPVAIPDMDGDPDFTLDTTGLAPTVLTEYQYFGSGDSAVQDGCVGSYGYRRLMKFAIRPVNVGQFDFYAAHPDYASLISYDPVHQYNHLRNMLQYQLLDLQGNAVTPPRQQQNWIPSDNVQFLSDPWVRPLKFYYWGRDPGLQRGWSDYIPRTTVCQWVDVTGLPNGSHKLRATINPLGSFRESNFTNNTKEVSINLIDTPGGIPNRPDGNFVSGQPLEAYPAPAGTRITYDVAEASCPATDYDLHYSHAPPGLYLYQGAVCSIGTSGDRVVTLPDPAPGGLVWFLIVGRNGASEGAHGFDSEGRWRPLTGIGSCGVLSSKPRSSCPQLL